MFITAWRGLSAAFELCCCFPGATAIGSSRMWPFQCCSLYVPNCYLVSMHLCQLSVLVQLVTVLLSLWWHPFGCRQAGSVQECATAGHPAETIITEGAAQGRARGLNTPSKSVPGIQPRSCPRESPLAFQGFCMVQSPRVINEDQRMDESSLLGCTWPSKW